jgi:hypothetical protein
LAIPREIHLRECCPRIECNLSRRAVSGPTISHSFYIITSIGLIGVLGATGACECALLRFPPSISLTPTDTLIRAIGKRAHTFHSIAFFSFNCVLGSTLGYASKPEFTRPKGSFDTTPAWYYLKLHRSFPRMLPGLLCCFSSAYLA